MDTHPRAADYLLRATGCAEVNERDREVVEAAERGDAVAYYEAAQRKGEAPGLWYGKIAETLGFMPGDVASSDDVRKLLGELKDPRTDQYLGRAPGRYKGFEEVMQEKLAAYPADLIEEKRRELYDEVKAEARTAKGFFDATFSAPKSVSLYHAALRAEGHSDLAEQVGKAHRAGIDAAVQYMEEHGAWVRRGAHKWVEGEYVGRWERAAGLGAIKFDHSTSRSEDPHLHTHVAIVNKTQSVEDGRWLSVDNRQWNNIKGVIANIYESVMAAEIERNTPARFEVRPDGLGREIVGLSQSDLQESSGRTQETLNAQARMVQQFTDRNGREPNAKELREIHRQAGLQSRAAKSDLTPDEQLQAWAGREEIDPSRYVTSIHASGEDLAAERAASGQLGPVDQDVLVRQVLAELQATKAVWNRGEFVARLSNQLQLADADGGEVTCTGLADALVDRALNVGSDFEVVELTRPDPGNVPDWWRHKATGQSVFRAPNAGIFTLRSHLTTEQALVADARRPGARTVTASDLQELEQELTSGPRPLGEDQAAAVLGVLGSGRMADVIVAPAGTGKSFAAGKLAELWERQHGGRVIGVATSQKAAQVLAEDGIDSLNSTRFLAAFDPKSAGRRDILTSRDLVVVDEAGMSATQDLSRIQRLAIAAGAKVVYQGDPEQLSPVGAAGALRLLATDNGAYELQEVRRFHEPWEGDASVRLRAGDTSALRLYEDHGRIRSGTKEQITDSAVQGYIADTLLGKSSALVTGTNEDASAISAYVQDRFKRIGRVTDRQVVDRLSDGNAAYVGDVIQARRNNMRNVSSTGAAVVNRDMYRVTGRDGDSITAELVGDPDTVVRLSDDYLREHVTLGYAGTEHYVQGVTVDTCHALKPGYVAMTRGAEKNIVYVETERAGSAEDPYLNTSARQVLERDFSQQGMELGAVQTLRAEAETSKDLAFISHHYDLAQGEIASDRHSQMVEYHLGPDLSGRLLTSTKDTEAERTDTYVGLLNSMRRAEMQGYDAEQVLQDAIGERDFAGAKDLGAVLRARFDRKLTEHAPAEAANWENSSDRIPGPIGEFEGELAAKMDQRARELGEQLAEKPEPWALQVVGEVPSDPQQLDEWKVRAGQLGAFRQAYRIPDQQVSIGAPPNPDDVLRWVWWQKASRAESRPVDELDYRAASDVELQAAMSRWERDQAWAPMYVSYEQGKAHEAAQAQAAAATVLAAEADNARGDAGQDLREQAERAQRIADRMAERATMLDDAAQVRAEWEQHTAPDRDAAYAARSELDRRGLLNPEPEPEPVQAALFELAGGDGDELDPSSVQQEHEEPQIEAEAEQADEAQAALFDVQATPRQDAEREAAEVELDQLDAEPVAGDRSLADVVKQANIAAQVISQHVESEQAQRQQAEAAEAQRAEQYRREGEREHQAERASEAQAQL